MSDIKCISFKAKKKSHKVGLFFHGYGADAADLSSFQQLLDQNRQMDWYFPEGILEVEIGPHFMGRAWFSIDIESMQKSMMSGKPRDLSGETRPEFNRCCETVENFLLKLNEQYDEFFIGGFSQGAMVVSHVALSLPAEKVKGLAFLSTNLVDAKKLSTSLEKVKYKIPYYQSHGLHDMVLGLQGAKKLFELYKKFGHEGIWEEFAGAHEIPPPVMHSLRKFFQQTMSL